MKPADLLAVRTDFAKLIGHKAESMRSEIERESYRLEGAQGCIAQVIEMLVAHQESASREYKENGGVEAEARAKTETLSAAIHACQGLQETARGQFLGVRGRLTQCDATLDMMEAIFTTELANARIAVARAEATERGEPNGHPGPSLADQRRGEAEAAVEGADGGDTGPQGADMLP